MDSKADKFENLVWGKKAKKALKEQSSGSEESVDSDEERVLMEKLKKIQAKKKKSKVQEKKSKVYVDEQVNKLKNIEVQKGYNFE